MELNKEEALMPHPVHALATMGVEFLCILFGIGLIGCVFVLVLTFIEDAKTIAER